MYFFVISLPIPIKNYIFHPFTVSDVETLCFICLLTSVEVFVNKLNPETPEKQQKALCTLVKHTDRNNIVQQSVTINVHQANCGDDNSPKLITSTVVAAESLAEGWFVLHQSSGRRSLEETLSDES